MLALSRTQAIKLYDEVVRKIEESNVDPISPSKLFRSGVDSLLIACEDTQFLKANFRGIEPARMSEFRELLRQWRSTAVRDRAEAGKHVLTISDQAHSMLDIPAAPVILEFVYGACDALDDYSTCLTPD